MRPHLLAVPLAAAILGSLAAISPGQPAAAQSSPTVWIRDIFCGPGLERVIVTNTGPEAVSLSGEISEASMMTLFGWKNSKEARHYSRQAAQQNAIEAHRKASPLEKLQK